MFPDVISRFFEGVLPAYEHYVGVSKKKDNKKFVLTNAAMMAADMLYHYREALASINTT